jgi:hypothetical protein
MTLDRAHGEMDFLPHVSVGAKGDIALNLQGYSQNES